MKEKLNAFVGKVKNVDKKVVAKVAVIGVMVLLAVGLAAYATQPEEELLEAPDEYYDLNPEEESSEEE